MKIATVLITDRDETGPYINVDDWRDLTVQVAGEFTGNIVLEGTLSSDPADAHWGVVATAYGDEIISLPAYSFAGLRARTDSLSGHVDIRVGGH